MFRLQYDPFLADVTHVIVDGVDTRSIHIDILLTYIRTLLPRRNSLRLVLISHDDDGHCRQRMQTYFKRLECVHNAAGTAEAVRA
jgi:HrpA-like RNA helicase